MRFPRSELSAVACLIASVLAAACGSEGRDAALGDLRDLPDPPAAPGAAQPHLATADDGRAYLSWLEPRSEEHALRFAILEDDAWSVPRTIAAGGDFFVNWADFPSVVPLPDGSLAAHWLVKSGPGTYAYDVHLARSEDGGDSWADPWIPHRDGTETEHGFVSLFPGEGGDLKLIWLDGRDFASDSGEPEMTLRHATFGSEGERREEGRVDGRVCDCCQTSVALTAEGPIAVYRDRSEDEIRDIRAVVHRDGAWGDPRPVHRDGWRIPACPVNGPSVAARDRRVAVAWYTAAGDRPRVRVAFSDDGGDSFGGPVRIDTGEPTGRVDVALLSDGSALVSWIETREGEAHLLVRRVPPGGSPLPPRRIAASTGERTGGFPQMELTGDRVVFAWTEPGDPTRIRAAVLGLEVSP